MFWPGIDKDIDKMISKCETCQTYRYKQTKEPMTVTDVPTAPWYKVGMDFHLKGKEYLVVIDYLSNYPEMALLSVMAADPLSVPFLEALGESI